MSSKISLPTKVLFLDIDGVLNSGNDFRAYWQVIHEPIPTDYIDPVKKQRLFDLLDWTGTKVVISSTWRKLPETIRSLQYQDILTYAHDMWKTVDYLGVGKTRGDEIAFWLEQNKADVYAIVDDDSDMLESQKPFFVQTDWNKGLTDENCEQIKKILGRKFLLPSSAE